MILDTPLTVRHLMWTAAGTVAAFIVGALTYYTYQNYVAIDQIIHFIRESMRAGQ